MHEFRNREKPRAWRFWWLSSVNILDVRLLFFRMWISLTRGSRWPLWTLFRAKNAIAPRFWLRRQFLFPWDLFHTWKKTVCRQLNTPRSVAWDFVGVRIRTRIMYRAPNGRHSKLERTEVMAPSHRTFWNLASFRRTFHWIKNAQTRSSHVTTNAFYL